jgi:flagellar protein FlaG
VADISVPSLILFIASIVIAAGVAGVLVDTVSGISSALDDRGADLSQEVRTDIEVISDPEAGVYDGNNITLYVKNTGLRTIPASADAVDVMVDGVYQTNVTVSVVDGTEWRPHDVVELTIGGQSSLADGDHRVKLVIDGDEEVFEFTK